MIKFVGAVKGFEDGMLAFQASVVEGSVLGMEKAMDKFLDDARNKPPSSPILTGALYDAHVTDVNKIGNKIIGTLHVAGLSYAAAVHAGVNPKGRITNWTRPGSGPNWIGSKALKYNDDYVRTIAGSIRSTVKRIAGFFRRKKK